MAAKFMFAGLTLPVLAVVLRFAPEQVAGLSYLVLVVHAFFGRRQAIESLVLSWFFTMVNPGLVSAVGIGTLGRHFVLAAAMIAVLIAALRPQNPLAISKPVTATLLVGAFLVVHSLFYSPMLDVSILRALSWTAVTVTCISAWRGLSEGERGQLEVRVFGALVLILVASIPLLALPVGYLRNAIDFQGVLNHPQAFGLTMALLGTWAGSKVLALRRPPWILMALFATSMALTVLSEARTAGLALVIGLGLAVVSVSLLGGRSVKSLLPGVRSGRVHVTAFALLLSLVLAWPVLAEGATSFLVGRGQAQTLREIYDASRGALVDAMLANIREHPLTGIGFSIASQPHLMVVERDAVLAFPIAASIEKGVAPLAVLEELGVVGLVAVLAWVAMLIREAARRGVAPLALLNVILLMNLGESTLFSPGSMGLLTLVLIGFCVSSETSAEGRNDA